MTAARRLALLALAALGLLAAGCGRGGDRTLTGRVTADGEPVPAAKVEAYLEAGRFRNSEPFAVAYTDEAGEFSLTLPRRPWHLVARAEAPEGGRLFGEYAGNPVDLGSRKEPPSPVIEVSPADVSRDYRGPDDSGIRGTLSGEGVDAAWVYVYDTDAGGLRGPNWLAARAVEPGGAFRVNLHPGRYWVAARVKAGGDKAGFVAEGDATAAHPDNPVTVTAGAFSDLAPLKLHPADPERLAAVARERSGGGGGTALEGVVLDEGGEGRPGLYVLAYDHPQMIGRPVALAVAGEGGRFSLALPRGGRYYLGARQQRSGPRNPGELAGGYEGTPDHAVDAADGARVSGLVIRVGEVW